MCQKKILARPSMDGTQCYYVVRSNGRTESQQMLRTVAGKTASAWFVPAMAPHDGSEERAGSDDVQFNKPSGSAWKLLRVVAEKRELVLCLEPRKFKFGVITTAPLVPPESHAACVDKTHGRSIQIQPTRAF